MRIIDADALKITCVEDLVIKGVNPSDYNRYQKGVMDCLTKLMPQVIDDAPTIDAEPVRHGHWTNDDCTWSDSTVWSNFANCSCCGYQYIVHYERGYHKYCPNCGAKMMDEVIV